MIFLFSSVVRRFCLAKTVPPENSAQPMAGVIPPNKPTALLQSGETNPPLRTRLRHCSDKELQTVRKRNMQPG
ncbi:MAG: hypothetical protein DMG42_22025 [Acidobacteria bacterium]|nr:MAG: hypothetical protein DMG42_22025 [Acidobacteriota bacterium]